MVPNLRRGKSLDLCCGVRTEYHASRQRSVTRLLHMLPCCHAQGRSQRVVLRDAEGLDTHHRKVEEGKSIMHRKLGRVVLPLVALLWMGISAPTTAHAQMCVKIARSLTHLNIRGDAWMWWQNAAGQYDRSTRPTVGSVLVFKRSGRMPRGHVSTVSAVINNRVVRVDHSWLDGEGMVRGMRVVDISPDNDWSNVRVWHPHTDSLGMRTYTAYGFIHSGRGRGLDSAVAGRMPRDLLDAVRHVDENDRDDVRDDGIMPGFAARLPGVRPLDRRLVSEPVSVRSPAPNLIPDISPSRAKPLPSGLRTVSLSTAASANDAILPRRKPILRTAGLGSNQVAALSGSLTERDGARR